MIYTDTILLLLFSIDDSESGCAAGGGRVRGDRGGHPRNQQVLLLPEQEEGQGLGHRGDQGLL